MLNLLYSAFHGYYTNEMPGTRYQTNSSDFVTSSCSEALNLKTDSKTLYYSILKLKYSPSILKLS